MKVIGIIPARYGSTRFPGKPLADILGVSMIERVYRQCKQCDSLHKVIVATDDQRILEHVKAFGGEVMLTSTQHQSGTDRCAEVINNLNEHFDVAINIQGDEPFISPEQINAVAQCFAQPQTQIASLVKKITNPLDIENPNVVKAVVGIGGKAIYFSRSPIPFNRNANNTVAYFKHVGIYGYKTDILKQITQLAAGVLETAESLEQLRWLENGFEITLAETNAETIAIDTPEDLNQVLEKFKA